MTSLMAILATALTISGVPQTRQRLAGDLWVSGTVTMNGVPATSGIAVFNDSQIKTGRGSSASVNLGQQGRIKLEPETDMTIQFGQKLIGGNQVSGLSAISKNPNVQMRVTTPHVLIECNACSQAALVSVEVKPEYTCVVVNQGLVTTTSGGKITQMRAGQALSFDANGPEKISHCEGLAGAAFVKPLIIGGGAAAAAIVPLARQSVAAVQSVPPATASSSGVTPPTVGNGNPTTPVDPPPAHIICGCPLDERGRSLVNGQKTLIQHVAGNGRCNTLEVDCNAITGHFNLNGTPRNGHLLDQCGTCPQ